MGSLKEFIDDMLGWEDEVGPPVEEDSGPDFIPAQVQRGWGDIEWLLDLMRDFKFIICGGYVRFMISPHTYPVPATDVDIYVANEATMMNLLAELTAKHDLKVTHENAVSITMREFDEDDEEYWDSSIDNPQVQIIKPFKNETMHMTGDDLESVLNNFDFTVVRCGIEYTDDRGYIVLADKDFEEDEKNKLLRIKRIHCPISGIQRVVKYSRKGYWIHPLESLKLLKDYEERSSEWKEEVEKSLRDLNDPNVKMTQERIDRLEELMRID